MSRVAAAPKSKDSAVRRLSRYLIRRIEDTSRTLTEVQKAEFLAALQEADERGELNQFDAALRHSDGVVGRVQADQHLPLEFGLDPSVYIQNKRVCANTPNDNEELITRIDPESEAEQVVWNILRSLIEFLLDADGRGSFNHQAISARVAAMAYILKIPSPGGGSTRDLSHEVGLAHSMVYRQINKVAEAISLMGDAAALSTATSITQTKFAAVTSK